MQEKYVSTLFLERIYLPSRCHVGGTENVQAD